ncbi:hypothetical protein SAMN04487944_101194 [Gracilibacillus ureilyticus]|uniref:Uncharacterized protein n=1 Tax=Gracilibacillus ureilyticus TaxID=531814 RepID=A0A1H9LCD5_9BACI|nr:hypothetical protein [Gracilibacillus ureilyticus]SER09064.1 hypothetical protein SAMN04487944_101194 [Gracilibacillus ureilyticus]
MKTVFDQIMNDEIFKKLVLIEFGFSEIEPREVEEWFKCEYPMEYEEFKQVFKNGNVVGFNPRLVEATTPEERNEILDKFFAKLEGGDKE